ncbi:MAG: ABC transporter permease [Actinobacteria bacterium]|nr:ABC transporter permease [Actinomycetota bacterium]
MKKELFGIYIIWYREIKKFFRDRPRIIGSIAQPAIFLLVLGSGLASSFQIFGGGGGKEFLSFMFPGIIAMTVLFTAFFSAMSIVWDREFGFLKEVLISPVSRTSIVIGKNLGGSTVAMIQGLIILIFAPIIKIQISWMSVLKLIPVTFLVAMSISSIGIALAARLRSMQAFQVLTNFILMPMFFLSGALFPLLNAPEWMKYIAMANPLSYGVDMMRTVVIGSTALQMYPVYLDIAVTAGVVVVMSILGIALFNRED